MQSRSGRALATAVSIAASALLLVVLVRGSFHAARPSVGPQQLLAGERPAGAVELAGLIASRLEHHGRRLGFALASRAGAPAVRVRYVGEVPDAFAPGRRAVVVGRLRGRVFVARRDTLRVSCADGRAADHC
jgi:cytochrome c-type biogenesis protein CcmE